MSYILDALNKSEKDRNKKRTPGIASLQEDTPQDGLGIKGFLAVLLILAVVNSIGVYFYFGETGPAPVAEPPLPAEEQPQLISPGPEVTAPADTPAKAYPEKIPVIEVTAHIFASDAELRMVKIDGISRREGDELGAGHRLIEITEKGLILELGGEQYELNVVEDWQSGQVSE